MAIQKSRSDGFRDKKTGQRTLERQMRIGISGVCFGSWFPYIVAGIYAAIMGYFTFRYHSIGGFGVETDFYAELVPQVKKLFAGEYSPLNYGAKGPVYSFLLGFFYLFFRDYFLAGIFLNIISSAVFIVAAYVLIAHVFKTLTAQIAIFAIIFNYHFQAYTYQAGSDMPFLALCALSMLFLFRSSAMRDIGISAVFGLLAFLTRYNGAFIPMGALVYFAVMQEGRIRDRLKRAGLWFVVFIAAGLPWFVPNWIVSGSPVRNDNYVNVMLEYYAYGSDTVSYENWTDAMPKKFTGMGDIILYNPVHFVKHTAKNIGSHFYRDIQNLMGIRFGLLMLLGIGASWFAGFERRKLAFFSFGMFYFLILSIVFYNPRFSLFLIVFYLPLAIWPFVSVSETGVLGRFFKAAPAVLMIIVLSYAVTTVKAIIFDFRNQPPILVDIRELGEMLGDYEPEKSKIIIARKPHVAYYAGLEFRMFPSNVKTVEEIVSHCRNNGIDYILYSGVEAVYRPEMERLFSVNMKQPGLKRLFHNNFGIIYKVTETSE